MPESGTTKHNYLFCQFVNPARGHEGDRCDCFDTPSQRRTTLAKQRLARLRANRGINRASTSNDPESAVASDPAVTPKAYGQAVGGITLERRTNVYTVNLGSEYKSCVQNLKRAGRPGSPNRQWGYRKLYRS